MFTYINNNFVHAPSTNLSRKVVKVLVQFMIAQATKVFVEHLTEEKEKRPFELRARVSTQAAFLFGSVLKDDKDLASKGIFDHSWTWLVQVSMLPAFFFHFLLMPVLLILIVL